MKRDANYVVVAVVGNYRCLLVSNSWNGEDASYKKDLIPDWKVCCSAINKERKAENDEAVAQIRRWRVVMKED
jgi:hypothetical protein